MLFSNKIRNNKFVAILLSRKLVTAFSALVAIVIFGGVLFYSLYTETETHTPALNTEQTTEPNTEKPLLDNPEMLDDMGLTKEAINESPSVGVSQGRCKGDKTYFYDPGGTLSVTTMQRGGTYICTTYEVNTVKTYVLDNGDTVTEETHANPDTGTRQTVRSTERDDGTSEVNIGYEAPDGSGMGWGGEGEEQCFGPNNTVCTMVDTGVQSYVEMLKTCILVSTGDSYWRLGTPEDNLAAEDTGTYMGSCSQWQSYKNLFYDK